MDATKPDVDVPSMIEKIIARTMDIVMVRRFPSHLLKKPPTKQPNMFANPIEARIVPAFTSDKCKIEVRNAGAHAKIPTIMATEAKLGRTKANILHVKSPLASTFTLSGDLIGGTQLVGNMASKVTRRQTMPVKISGGLQSTPIMSNGRSADEIICDAPYPNPKTLIAESSSSSGNHDERIRTAEGNVTPQATPARAR